MATGEDIKSSIVASSEEIFDKCCSPCSESGYVKEAVKFCVDCGSYFCSKCLEYHNKFPALRSHQILDTSDRSGRKTETGPDLPTERCAVHHGKLVNMFCKDHDEVCCAACIAIKHRSCINVDYLPDVAKGINNNAEYKETKLSLENILTKMRSEIEAKINSLKRLQEDKDNLLEEIENLKAEILMKVEELAETSKEQISLKYEEVRKRIQSDLDMLNTGLTKPTLGLKKLSEKNESQLFVNMKASKQSIRDCEALVCDLSKDKDAEKLRFVVDTGFKDRLNGIECFVSGVDMGVKEYKATRSGKYKTDPEHCEVTGICAMDDGSFVIADYTHSKLKRLNEKLKITDFVVVSGNPFSVCRVRSNEVATYLQGRSQIQFVTVGQTMQLVSTINVGKSNFPIGVCCDTTLQAFLLCDMTKLFVYGQSGDLVNTYAKDKNGKNLFKQARQVVISKTDQLMIVSDGIEDNLKAVTRDGEISWTFKDLALKVPWGVCILPGDIILVSGLNSNNVFQVDKKGRKIGELLGVSEQLNKPFALAFDERSSRLLVGCSSNEIHVYTLSKT